MVRLLPPPPPVQLRAELPGQLVHRLLQRRAQERVPGPHGVLPEAPVGGQDPPDHGGEGRPTEMLTALLRHDEVRHPAPDRALPRHVDPGGHGSGVQDVVPAQEPTPRLLHRARPGLHVLQQGHQDPGGDGELVGLEPHHVGHPVAAPRRQHLGDPGPSVRVRPLEAHGVHVGIVVGHQLVVRRGDDPPVGIHLVGPLADGEEALPLVAAITRNRQEPAPASPDRRDPHGLPADGAAGVGPDHVLAREVGVGARLPELLPAPGLIHAQAGQVR